MDKKSLIGIGLAAIIITLLFVISPKSGETKNLDDFAKCLTEKNAKMWGAYWCSHCQNQKKQFGNSWQYATYIECSLPDATGQTKECEDAGISAYPTWEFGDGERVQGEVTLQNLSEKTGCPLP